VFVPRAFADRVTVCRVANGDDATRASDHFPLLADLSV